MGPLLHLLPLSSIAASDAWVASFWQGALLVAAVALSLRLVPRVTAAARSLLWMVVLLALVSLHVVPLLRQTAGAGIGGEQTVLHIDIRWSMALAMVWSVLTVTRLTQLARSALRMRRVVRRSEPMEVSSACAALLAGSRCGVRLCRSADLDRPSVAGFFAPRVLIPADLALTLSELELQQIILHEMEHLRRGDDWSNLLQKLVLAFFPLNPALWWVERRLCLERELACDDGVLRRTGARKAYATCLATLAEHRLVRRGMTLALGAWSRPSELSRRVRRILAGPVVAGSRATTANMAVLLLFIGGGAALLSRSPELVSFAPSGANAVAGASFVRTSAGLWSGPGAHMMPAVAMARPAARMVPAVAHLPVTRTAATRSLSLAHRSVTSTSGSQRFASVQVRAVRSARQRRPMQIKVAARATQPGWRIVSPQPRWFAATATQDFVSYAAVPFRGGWLIFQL